MNGQDGLRAMLALYLVADALWPRYVAITVPRMPYITPARAILTLLIVGWLSAAATERSLRQQLYDRLAAVKWITVPLVVIVTLKLIAIPFSPYPRLAAKSFVNQTITWYVPFLLAVSLLRSREDLRRGALVLVVAASLLGVLVAWEQFTQVNPYTATLGSFVTVDARWIADVFRPRFRAGRYRAFGPFVAPLSLAELLTLAIPFALYCREQAVRRGAKVTLAFCVALLAYGTFAAYARTAMVTSGIILGLYFILGMGPVAYRETTLRRRRSLGLRVALVAVALLPAALWAIQELDWQDAFGAGGTRIVQLELARPLLADRPIVGYGPGNGVAALMLQHRPNGVDLTIDNYFLTAAIETGFPGLITFLVLMVAFLGSAYRRAFEPRADASLYLAFALFGSAFALTRATVSQDDNMSLFYVVLGAFVALTTMPPAVGPAESEASQHR